MTPYYQDSWLTVYGGDCREVMRSMEPESVHCVVTSPPYWGLRDYGTASWEGGDEGCDHKPAFQPRSERPNPTGAGIGKTGYAGQEPNYRATCGKCGARRQDSQLGLEATPEEYVANMVDVFREVRRVLRSDGTVWLNLGDSYNAYNGGAGPSSSISAGASTTERPRLESGFGLRYKGLKPKDLVGIPWRVAFALQADGWWLRSDIVWNKPNPMPESVTDRPTKSHEYVFLLSKSPRYFFDADAVREPAAYPDGMNGRQPVTSPHGQGFAAARSNGATASGRNLRSVWTIATTPYGNVRVKRAGYWESLSHFAVFPRRLVEPCVKAGTSERGVCPECGAPWVRQVLRAANPSKFAADPAGGRGFPKASEGHNIQSSKSMHRNGSDVQGPPPVTTGWASSCAHTADPIPATVLDPFAGSGTTGVVAQHLGRRAVLIDLNPDYLTQAMARNRDIPLGLVG